MVQGIRKYKRRNYTRVLFWALFDLNTLIDQIKMKRN